MHETNATRDLSPVDVANTHILLTAPVYRFVGFRVLDVTGSQIGVVEWVWADSTNPTGEAIGIHLRWLRGTVRVVPTHGATVDLEASSIRVPFTREQMTRAPRFSMGRELSLQHWRAVHVHFGLQVIDSPFPSVARQIQLPARRSFGVRAGQSSE